MVLGWRSGGGLCWRAIRQGIASRRLIDQKQAIVLAQGNRYRGNLPRVQLVLANLNWQSDVRCGWTYLDPFRPRPNPCCYLRRRPIGVQFFEDLLRNHDVSIEPPQDINAIDENQIVDRRRVGYDNLHRVRKPPAVFASRSTSSTDNGSKIPCDLRNPSIS